MQGHLLIFKGIFSGSIVKNREQEKTLAIMPDVFVKAQMHTHKNKQFCQKFY